MPPTRREILVGSAFLGMAAGAGHAVAAPPLLQRRVRTVEQRFEGLPTTDGAGVQLERLIGQPALRNLDPFILLDRLHSDQPDAYIRGFPDHPHRGFETVTVMLSGRLVHRDSRGNQGEISAGGAQWMTAGRGIVHSEMPQQTEGLLSGFQLWVNLPAKEKLCPPAYQDLQSTQLARERLTRSGSALSVIAGSIQGVRGPVRERPTAPVLATLTLEDDSPFTMELSSGHTAFVFVAEGDLEVGPKNSASRLGAGTLGVLGPGERLRLRAPVMRTSLLVAAGRPLREPIVQRGPFVMNTEAEIQQAFEDYRRGVLDRG